MAGKIKKRKNAETALKTGLQDAYFGKPHRLRTWSNIVIKDAYTAGETPCPGAESDTGKPGAFPYTRGIHPGGYRGKLWTRREVCGYGTGKNTNERLHFLMREGESGLSVIFDIPTMTGLDTDHPDVRDEIGVQGTSISCLDDMRELTAGIPLDQVSFSLVVTSYAAPIIFAMYLLCAKERGYDWKKLRGTVQNDPLHHRFCGYPQEFTPVELSLKTAVDIIEFCAKNVPFWYPQNVNSYDLRDNCLNAQQEIAYSFAMAFAYIDAALERGLHIDDFAPRIAFYCSCHIDLLEEAAKLRAMRRLWAKLMKEKYNPEDERSLQFRFGVHTAGITLVPQQPLNNIVRVTIQALAAILGGAQSLHCCSYDEPICLPTEEAHRVAVRTQQILAFETSLASTPDPLGGSYYVEWLTDKLEKEAGKILAEIKNRGGMLECIKSGWVDAEIELATYEWQKDLKEKERLIVGSNCFRLDAEKDTKVNVHRVPKSVAAKQIQRLRKLRQKRSHQELLGALKKLFDEACNNKNTNLIPFIFGTLEAGGTLGEILGTIRQAWGLPYDPLNKKQPLVQMGKTT